jgi:hypothetical protein
LGNYSVDIRVYDIFYNRIIVENATSFEVVEEITTSTPPPADGMIFVMAGIGIAIFGIILIIWRVKRG